MQEAQPYGMLSPQDPEPLLKYVPSLQSSKQGTGPIALKVVERGPKARPHGAQGRGRKPSKTMARPMHLGSGLWSPARAEGQVLWHLRQAKESLQNHGARSGGTQVRGKRSSKSKGPNSRGA